MAGGTRTIYEFGGFRLDGGRRLLVTRDGGETVKLTSKGFETLLCLVEHRGKTLEKEQLLRTVWPDTVVDENNLNQRISELRRAFGEKQGDNRYIATVPGRGFKFVADVRTVAGQEDDERTDSNVTREPTSVVRLAVLPFDNLTADVDREYLADGLTEELIAILGSIDPDRLAVIGRTSMMTYKARTKSIGEIGRELQATHVIEGSIRAEGDSIRVTAKLIHAAQQCATWSASYDAEPVSILAFQRELSTVIAEQIRVRLPPASLNSIGHRQTRNSEAYDLYLRGRHFWNPLTPAANARAIDCFERAIALDPGYALAWAGIAFVLLGSSMNSDAPPDRVRRRAREAASRAVQADPDLADAQAAIGYVDFLLDWNWPAAEGEFRRAIALDPGCAIAHRYLGHLLSQTERHAEAWPIMRRLCEFDPLHAMNHAMMSQVAFQARDYALALQHARQSVVIDPEFWIGYVQLGQAYGQTGSFERALEALMRAARLSGGNSKALSMRAFLLARSGRAEDARELLTMLETVARDRYVPPYAIALVHAGLGHRDAVFDALDKAAAARDVHLIFLPVDPRWDDYRSDPRFDAVLARCGFTQTAV
jgi:DNA-binding winged helix-turn-helix (wHTH) protein/tetratricopeptide (TPR) repeat protein